MRSRRGFFQTLLATVAAALTKARVKPCPACGSSPACGSRPWRAVPMESVFVHVRREPFQLEYFSWAESKPGFAIGHTADLARIDFQ